MGAEYEQLTDAEQVEALRPVAVQAAAAFGLAVVRLELVLHAFNTTFEVDSADGRRFALRVGTNSDTTVAHAIAQQAWVAAIAAQTDVLVPEPLRTPAGEWCVEVPSEALGRPLVVTVAAWLDGPDADELGADAARALGGTMARLHAQAEAWQLPPGGALPTFDEPLFGDADRLDTAPGLTAADRAVLDDARSRAVDAFDRLYADAALRPLHADLHGGNLKWQGGRLAVFDFDDAGFGLPVLDLAISTFYLRGEDGAAEAALREGYAALAPLPEVAPADFEALIAARQLLLANSMLSLSTAELRAQAAEYAQTAVGRLRRWLETGRFTRAEA